MRFSVPGKAPRGITLVAVLWIIVLLSLISSVLVSHSRSNSKITYNLENSSRAAHAADAGLHWAYWGLLLYEPQIPWLADGSVHRMTVNDIEVTAAVFDEYGKIDLNLASKEMLNALLIAAQLKDEQADSLSDAILDWRDEDDLKRLKGAEDEAYQEAGYRWDAKDAPFDSIYELKQVLGMNQNIFKRIETSVTVHSGKRAVNPLVAPRLVLMALGNWDEYQADSFIEDRRQQHKDGLKVSTDALISPFFTTSLVGLNYTVFTQAVINTNTRSGMSVVIRRQGGRGKETFEILDMHSLSTEIFSDDLLN